MSLVRLFPTFQKYESISSDEESWIIAKEYGICNGWRVNFAIDSSGKSFGETGSSSDISSDLDRLLLGKLRSMADVIVTSGKTARLEKYRSSKHAPIAIFTSSGDLDSVPAIQGTQYFTPLVITPLSKVDQVAQNLSDVDVKILAYPGSENQPGWVTSIAEVIQSEGYQSPILESGQTTLRQFISEHVVDEICLSVTHPRSTGVSARDLGASRISQLFGSIRGYELLQLFTDGQTTFSRWRRGSLAT